MTKDFFKMSNSCSARFRRARSARTSGSRYLDTAYFGHELRLLPTVEQLGADAQLLSRRLRAAAFSC